MVELVDTLDLKSNDHCGRAGSSPAPSTLTGDSRKIVSRFCLYTFVKQKKVQNKEKIYLYYFP